MVRIPGFHPGDPGSIPGRGNFWNREAMAQLAARRIPDPKVGGSTPSSFIVNNFYTRNMTQYLNTSENVPVTSVIPNNKPTKFITALHGAVKSLLSSV